MEVRKIILLSAILVLLLSLAACQAAVDKAKENMAAALAVFGEELGSFSELDDNSNKEDVDRAVSKLGPA